MTELEVDALYYQMLIYLGYVLDTFMRPEAVVPGALQRPDHLEEY